MKRILTILLCCAALLAGCGEQTTEPANDGRMKVVATVFPAYDFARAAAGELASVELLLPPGMDSHSYEPTPADILAVQECDLFLYLGGETDAWVETILAAAEPKGKTLRMIDCVELLAEEHVEGMQAGPGHDHDHAHGEEEADHDGGENPAEEHRLGEVVGMDEHVWTSPKNAAAITRCIGETMAELDRADADRYQAGAERYAQELEALHGEFARFFAERGDRTMVFGDRFPLRYFAEEYDLDYYAAFPGCGTQTEPSAATVAFLTDKVRAEGISTIWYIEFSNHLVADSIAEATGAETAMFHTCHNVSRVELESGATCLSLMRNNLETLKQH